MLKKILPWAVVVVVLFLIGRNPIGAAAAGRHLGSGVASAAGHLAQFLTSLIGGK